MNSNDNDRGSSHPADAIHAWSGEWRQKFRAMLEHGWPLAEVAALHDDLDRIASAADGLRDSDLASAAVELSVYLCSFVEDGRNPDASQREKLLRLSGALAGDAAAAMTTTPAVISKPSRLSHLLYVSEDAALVAELSLR